MSTSEQQQAPPGTIADYDERSNGSWVISFGAAMIPFAGFLYGHGRGMTVRVVEAVVRSPLGPAGLLLLPFATLGFEKCIYDTAQSVQGINPNMRPADRGGFPSGGADLPSFSLVPIMKWDNEKRSFIRQPIQPSI
mmetsp:Transcript_29253/g.48336  ORF Transcript_29253/g.48336 Transcript_29253/m.48336 type:complete len:136 (+) Transcript_29253:157-564(+)|eukprot:CAMPEP_0119017746 /NCGR_PEP_ID=MMETSP1176-20130426/17561_1 /TAXON_ID=265551 /ORGANISM="Synedropsis recta cf, Strain CCMP1620" /LENGTH=135 /DNA_ID=CAMNT_0006971563 /DNA_START=51 /DNA_END=458 /DNA_ORIENTATION=-